MQRYSSLLLLFGCQTRRQERWSTTGQRMGSAAAAAAVMNSRGVEAVFSQSGRRAWADKGQIRAHVLRLELEIK